MDYNCGFCGIQDPATEQLVNPMAHLSNGKCLGIIGPLWISHDLAFLNGGVMGIHLEYIGHQLVTANY